MKVIVWNMNWKRANGNWSAFTDSAELGCDIALLNEATPAPPGLGLHVLTKGKTIGRDDVSYGGKKTRKWATAVVSPHPLARPKDVWALPPKDGDRRSKLMVSRRGSWTAAVVSLIKGEKVTAISIYGLLDERSDASVHRSLSDLTPLLEDERYNELLLLGGDLNTLCTAKAGTQRLARDQGVLDRITHGFGLVDLLQKTLHERQEEAVREGRQPRGRLKGCTCSLGEDCLHTWTFRRSKGSAKAYQDDYLFASPTLSDRLDECVALEFSLDWPSDHVPIVAMFR
jgi:hypothetical protein